MTTRNRGCAATAISARHTSREPPTRGGGCRKLVGQGDQRDFLAAGRSEAQVSVVDRGDLRHREEIRATVGSARSVEHRSAWLLAEAGAEKTRSRLPERRFRVRQYGAFLAPAEILGSGNDFLSGIATLLKADTPDRVPVERLRDELVLRSGKNQGHA